MSKAENLSFVLKDIKSVALEDRPKPELTDDHDVLVHVGQTGICGSDVHYWQRGRIGEYVLTGPMVLGHESSGTIAEVGKKVVGLKAGDKVAMEPGVPCRRCDYCREGSYHLCGEMKFAATPPYDGTLAKYYINASDFCYKLPDNMDLEEGAMVEPVSVAVAISKTGNLRPHNTVVVMGCGPIGVLCQAVAKAWGASKVIGVDVVPSRLEVAESYGVDHTYIPPRAEPGADPMAHAEKVANIMKEKFNLGEGADIVLECSGAEPCIQLGVFVARRGATIVQAGMGKEVVSFPITTVCIRGLTIKGSIRYITGCYPAAIALISSGRIKVKKLITNKYKFEESEAAFELVKAGRPDVFKVMIEGVQD
ncbi:chaperonin 10-like protein [Lipomyces oligophaga]|uniref:chaperonin 10-like protein n=1 Tax=Lipomyces oligophaga TaxID=45792 RepID=UPI0034CD133B